MAVIRRYKTIRVKCTGVHRRQSTLAVRLWRLYTDNIRSSHQDLKHQFSGGRLFIRCHV